MQHSAVWDRVQFPWTQAVGYVRQQWDRLTDNDVAQLTGQREQLAGLIQERYGVTRQEAERQIDEWAEKLHFS